MTDRERFTPTQSVTGQSQTPVKPASGYSDVSERTDSGEQRDVAARAREQAEHAREVADEQRERAAHGMERAADSLRERSEQLPGGERTTEMANRAADKVEGVATYLQDTDVSSMVHDVERIVRDHPRESLIAAVAVGFLVGRSLRS